MGDTRLTWSVGYWELTKEEMGFKSLPNLEKFIHFHGWFSRFAFIFCKKRAFFGLRSIFSWIWLSLWFWNLDILKVHSISDLTVYNMSIFEKNWSIQIFFTKKCRLSHKEVVIAWTFSYQPILILAPFITALIGVRKLSRVCPGWVLWWRVY